MPRIDSSEAKVFRIPRGLPSVAGQASARTGAPERESDLRGHVDGGGSAISANIFKKRAVSPNPFAENDYEAGTPSHW